jgi:ubiquinone/menaquinone biosynthesis C-methylase UbiE
VNEPDPRDEQDEKEWVAGVFGRIAPDFDRIGPRFFSVFGERLATRARIRPGQKVLDVGCGRGASAIPAAGLAGSNGRVVAVDLAERMVAELKLDAAGLGLTNLETAVMDAEELLLPDAVFDRVLGGFCLFFFPAPDRALAEMRRVLRPDGLLALSTWDKRDADWQWFDDLIGAYLRGSETTRTGRGRRSDLTDSPAKMRDLLRRAGFDAVDVVEETEDIVYAGEDQWWASLWTHGRRRHLERIEETLGSAGLARFEAESREQLRRRGLLGDDGVRQTLSVLYSTARRP